MEVNSERWKTIDAFPLYEVSNKGRIRKLDGSTNGYILRLSKTRHGYLQVSLYDGHGYAKHCRVNRLVAIAFLADENTNLKYDVHHIDRNKQNNDVTNLQFLSHRDNCLETANKREVLQYDLKGTLISTFPTIVSAASAMGCTPPTIAYHCRHKNHLYKGYNWLFKDDDNNNK